MMDLCRCLIMIWHSVAHVAGGTQEDEHTGDRQLKPTAQTQTLKVVDIVFYIFDSTLSLDYAHNTAHFESNTKTNLIFSH